MSNQLTTIEGHDLNELCKAGGLQGIFDLSKEASSEILDVTVKADRVRAKSLASKVSKSKTLFVKACRAHIGKKKEEIREAEKEIRGFESSMNNLRDERKAAALAFEEKEAQDALERERIAQEELEKERAEREQERLDNALLINHMDAIITNSEFDGMTQDIDIARFHCENKGREFDAVSWQIDVDKKEAEEQERDFKENIAPAIEEPPRFVMPTAKSIPSVTVNEPETDYQALAAAEDLIKHVPSIAIDTALLIVDVIDKGLIDSIVFERG